MELAQEIATYTINDIYALPDGQRAELIDGQIYMMATPSTKHQRLVSKLNQIIANYIDLKNGGCEIFPAPFAVFLNADEKLYLEPDLSVICDRKKLTEQGCNGAPDWIIEIVSPGSIRMDYYIKLFKYRNAAVKEYWIVDPDKHRILVYNFVHDTIGEYTFSDSIKAGIYGDLEIDFSTIHIV